jgi:hypothetical protein
MTLSHMPDDVLNKIIKQADETFVDKINKITTYTELGLALNSVYKVGRIIDAEFLGLFNNGSVYNLEFTVLSCDASHYNINKGMYIVIKVNYYVKQVEIAIVSKIINENGESSFLETGPRRKIMKTDAVNIISIEFDNEKYLI